jgi:hypothetical protein
MQLNELWILYEADKPILGFSPHTLKDYSLQLKMLMCKLGTSKLGKFLFNRLLCLSWTQNFVK